MCYKVSNVLPSELKECFVSLLPSFGQVSDVWDEIITQDKKTSRRRKSHVKELKAAHEVMAVGLLFFTREWLRVEIAKTDCFKRLSLVSSLSKYIVVFCRWVMPFMSRMQRPG